MCHGQILTDAMRTARKVHKCDECGRVIERGREYVYRAGIFDRRFDAYRMCVLCSAAEDDLRDASGESCYSRGDLVDHMQWSIRVEGWRDTLKAMRAKVAALRARYGRKRGEQPATGEGGADATTRIRAVAGTSRVCRVCGCRWKIHADGTHQLYDSAEKPGACCDNASDPPLNDEEPPAASEGGA